MTVGMAVVSHPQVTSDDDSSVRHVKDDDGNPDNLVGVAGDRR